MMNENKLNEDVPNLVSGGVLREGWDAAPSVQL